MLIIRMTRMCVCVGVHACVRACVRVCVFVPMCDTDVTMWRSRRVASQWGRHCMVLTVDGNGDFLEGVGGVLTNDGRM